MSDWIRVCQQALCSSLSRRHGIWRMLGALALGLKPIQLCLAADWGGRLADGARIEVDSDTRRAWRLEEGRRTLLWDGVHHLEDGSIVIVRDGVAVPTESMLRAWETPPARRRVADEVDLAPCRELNELVCGREGQCAQTEPCRLARELLEMARETLPAELELQADSSVGSQCREALGNPFFTPCR